VKHTAAAHLTLSFFYSWSFRIRFQSRWKFEQWHEQWQ